MARVTLPSPPSSSSLSVDVDRRKNSGVYCLLLVLLFTLCPSLASGRDLVVKTNYGRVRGLRENVNGKYVDSFLGIPYAKPPVGDLRFKHPLPAEPWEGVFNATERPNTCWQVTDTTYPGESIYKRKIERKESCYQ